jgi:solute carrier family 12 (potassium/chloride transporters), member 9
VLCLSSTATYRCIINGDVDVNGRVEDILGEDGWWQDLKQLRSASSSSTPMAASAFAQASRAFRKSLVDFSPSNRTDFAPGPLARRTSVASGSRPSISVAALPKRRQSMAVLPQSFSMRMGVGKPGYFSHVSSESSSSEESDNGEDSASDFDHDFDEAVASDDSIEESVDPLQKTDYFSRSASRHSKPGKSPLDEIAPGKRGAFSASAHASLDVDDDDRPHVSFKSTPQPHSHHHHHTPELELDFNILPARAQYLILNDLIKSYSEDTAVVFTTLPAPAQGTYQDEEKSLEYVGGLELLCEDIPPVLLIHSNSLVVTLAL